MELKCDLHAVVSAKVQTLVVITLVGNLNDLGSFKHSYANFRNKGDVKASLVFNAFGEIRVPYVEHTLFRQVVTWSLSAHSWLTA